MNSMKTNLFSLAGALTRLAAFHARSVAAVETVGGVPIPLKESGRAAVAEIGDDQMNFGSADRCGIVHRDALVVIPRGDGWPCQPSRSAPPEPGSHRSKFAS
jgi:hypothetical protein